MSIIHISYTYYNFNITRREFDENNFFILNIAKTGTNYIFPRHDLNGKRFIHIPAKTTKNTKLNYEPYREAWHLLE